MKSWNTPDHHIADTEHGTLHLAGGVTVVIADWEITEDAPDSDGRIYKRIRGWIANDTNSGTPIEAGRAHLLHAELRGQPPIGDLGVHVDIRTFGKPRPNTWDHAGVLLTVEWMDRRVDEHGQPIPDDKIGVDFWEHPDTGQIFDLRAAYVPTDGQYDPRVWVWRHYDRWQGDVPVLQVFRADEQAPAGLNTRLLTDGQWQTVAEALATADARRAARA